MVGAVSVAATVQKRCSVNWSICNNQVQLIPRGQLSKREMAHQREGLKLDAIGQTCGGGRRVFDILAASEDLSK